MRFFILILSLCFSFQIQAAITRHAQVFKRAHTGWVDEGIMKVTYYSGWELKDVVSGIDQGAVYCFVSVNQNGYGRLIELDYKVLANGMVFRANNLMDLYAGTQLEVKGMSFGGKQSIRYRIKGRTREGWFKGEEPTSYDYNIRVMEDKENIKEPQHHEAEAEH